MRKKEDEFEEELDNKNFGNSLLNGCDWDQKVYRLQGQLFNFRFIQFYIASP